MSSQGGKEEGSGVKHVQAVTTYREKNVHTLLVCPVKGTHKHLSSTHSVAGDHAELVRVVVGPVMAWPPASAPPGGALLAGR